MVAFKSNFFFSWCFSVFSKSTVKPSYFYDKEKFVFLKKKSTSKLILGFSSITFEIYTLEVSVLYFNN